MLCYASVAVNTDVFERDVLVAFELADSIRPNGGYYRQQMLQYENNIARLNIEVEKANEGRNVLFRG